MPVELGGGPPWEYVELVLCRDVYHCTPSELDRQDWARVRAHLACLNVESRVADEKARAKGMR